MINYNNMKTKLLFDKNEIRKVVLRIGNAISKKYIGKNPIFIGILNGSFVFLADLLRTINFDCEIDFIKVHSYDGTKSTGEIKLIKDISIDIKNRHIILVEDIIDSGRTIQFLLDNFKNKSCKSISIITLLMKLKKNKVDFPIDYVGFKIEQKFVVGYGLDLNQRFRNLDGIYVLD